MQGKIKTFKTGSQNSKILAYLQEDGNTLTVMECLMNGWGANLRSRVSDLKNAGYNIQSEMIPIDGGFVARYKFSD